MGKQKKSNPLGRAIIKDSRSGARRKRRQDPNVQGLYTTEIADERGKVMQSITESNNLQEFLEVAILADTDFEAEHESKIVLENTAFAYESEEADPTRRMELSDRQEGALRIPRRPPWDETTTAEELDKRERECFLMWRRKLAEVEKKEQEKEKSSNYKQKPLLMTPFEKNIEVWRQLWRVVERSHLIIQIIDARNPLLFWCKDLDRYVRELTGEITTEEIDQNVNDQLQMEEEKGDQAEEENNAEKNVNAEDEEKPSVTKEQEKSTTNIEDEENAEEDEEDEESYATRPDRVKRPPREERKMDYLNQKRKIFGHKNTMLILNKADLLTAGQRKYWLQYFESQNVDVCFFSATTEKDRIEKERAELLNSQFESDDDDESGSKKQVSGSNRDESDSSDEEVDEKDNDSPLPKQTQSTTAKIDPMEKDHNEQDEHVEEDEEEKEEEEEEEEEVDNETSLTNTNDKSRILTRNELLQLFEAKKPEEVNINQFVVGMVGYPNVGKSSTINVLATSKKVAESATPGKTKHFQTIHLDDFPIVLCDCPGLVFPSFLATKAEMICAGLLPIDQLREYVTPVDLVCKLISRVTLENKYGISLPHPGPREDPNRPPTGHELLISYAANRGFMTSRHGQPDEARAARIILKDFVSGIILFSYPPPGVDLKEYNKDLEIENKKRFTNFNNQKAPAHKTSGALLPDEAQHEATLDYIQPQRAKENGRKFKRRAAMARKLQQEQEKGAKVIAGVRVTGKGTSGFSGRVKYPHQKS